ncbi:MAG: cytochrome c, partial [Deltaproteobacteria bacterium]|nr:cytochrome c [Deltaproteobacteria bacterium]
ACHRIKDPASGRARFQDLTRIGRKRDKRWLIVWLKGADKVKPGTFMPDFPFTDDEVEAVAEYLSVLK